ncbi:MAG: hypothetical protein CL537_08230 [Alcanivoracaceae bacterium]|nr:hypothetical protein [Alcanivoracaceae bacterium]MCG8415138.1 hypothetical protein [Pseudomonadales bacterium]
MCELSPEDRLKTLDQVLISDPRNSHIPLGDWHGYIDSILLNEKVPRNVKQLFENAKNVALYSLFAYRLHQASEAVAYTALEKALIEKYEIEKEGITDKKPRNLQGYMDLALKYGWVTDEGYTSSWSLAESRVRDRMVFEMIQKGLVTKEGVPSPVPTEEQVRQELRDMEVARSRLHAGRHVRNHLAHGDGGLSDSSVGTLALVAEEINQLFS